MESPVLILLLLSSWSAFVQGEGFASGTINLGGLEVIQVSNFQKVWTILEGGPDHAGATFYEPSSIPDGFFMLGSYGQANNKPRSGWILLGKDMEQNSNSTLKPPTDYKLIWSSESANIKKDGEGYFWLPVAPDGYNAVGLVVTNSSEKPPLDKVGCVRGDLVDASQKYRWIWGKGGLGGKVTINFWGLTPSVRHTDSLGVHVGTFVAQVDGASAIPQYCLKNNNYSSWYMPNLTQIDTLVRARSPLIYFHPDESYLPSSVEWFFNKGVLLYQNGSESNPIPVQPDGANLPQGGADDGAYWLDLPSDEDARDEIKKGDLQLSKAYLHVKPMMGATFTDIAFWIFYPFNGPARAKVKFFDVPFKRLGEHVGDWEHVTLRFSNFNGELWRVYFSQHAKGEWLDATQVEFQGNKIVVYSSLHGHAAYPRPGLVLQGDAKLDIGIRNDAARSNNMMDTSMRYEVVSAEYLGGNVTEPRWLGYCRTWGPKITYRSGKELEDVVKIIHKIDKHVDASKVIPAEVIGETGPTGPKMKNNWSEDEVV